MKPAKIAQIIGFLLIAFGAILMGAGYATGELSTGIRIGLLGLVVWAVARTVEWYRRD